MIILLTILGFIISYLLYLLILKPLISLRFYQQQGCDMRFFAIKGQLKFNIDSLVKMGDFYGYWKQIVKDNPEIPAFGGNLRENTQLLLVDPALIKELYSKQHYYIKAPALINLYKYIAPYGISVLEGESWKRHRRLIGSAFHHDLLREMVPHIVKTSEKLCEEMKRDDLKAVDTTLQFEHISGEAIGGLFFGESFSEYQIKGKPLMAFLNELVGKLGSQLPTMMYLLFGINAIKSGILPIYRSINADRRELFEFATAVVEKKIEAAKLKAKDNKTLTNLIDILVKQSQGSSSSEDTFSPEEIVSEFITFLEAGKDNTAITLTNGLYYLHKNPQYKETLMKEINKYFQDASTVTLDDLNKMEFTGAFLKETMRLSPSESGVAEKVALEDHTLGKLKIKKGTFVDIAVLSNNYNSKYHDDVDKFMPERWLDDCKTKESVGKDPYIYLPFSIGKRNCIGQHFAMIEMKIILSIFLKKFEFSLPDDYELKMTQRFFYVPLKTMYFKLTPKDIFIR